MAHSGCGEGGTDAARGIQVTAQIIPFPKPYRPRLVAVTDEDELRASLQRAVSWWEQEYRRRDAELFGERPCDSGEPDGAA
jgi:prophage tail gpP-like protein